MKQSREVFPLYGKEDFVCPSCSVYSQHDWYEILENQEGDLEISPFLRSLSDNTLARAFSMNERSVSFFKEEMNGYFTDNVTALSLCIHCGKPAFWINGNLVFPHNPSVSLPNQDMPEEVMKLYNEAREISVLSPRASAALLRLALEKLLPFLGAQGKNINDMIGDLVSKGLPKQIQQALDSLRVIGNFAVHPGEIDLDDNKDIALALFKLINFVVEEMITRKNEIKDIYGLIPDEKKKGIEKRDKL